MPNDKLDSTEVADATAAPSVLLLFAPRGPGGRKNRGAIGFLATLAPEERARALTPIPPELDYMDDATKNPD